jgi:hypothetical protein
MEIEHLRLACELFRSIEKKDPESVLPRELPEVVQFKSNKEYVRKVLETQVDLSADLTEFVPMDQLPEGHRFHRYQKAVHGDGPVPSEAVIEEHKRARGGEYRVQPGRRAPGCECPDPAE